MKRILGLLMMLSFATSSLAQLYEEQIGDVILAGNDDGSVRIDLPFPIRLYNQTHTTSMWINNNGNVTFNAALGTYTAFAFPNNDNIPIVAPFFADVDTRPAASGKVHYRFAGDRMIITWNGVGYYSNRTDKKNRFQLILTNDGLAGFSYDYMQWTTGDASNGSGGFGGSSAIAGFDAGDGQNALVFWTGNTPQSLTELARTTRWYNLLTGSPSEDLHPPNTSIVSGPAEGSITNADPVRFTVTGSDDVTPVNRLEYQYSVNGAEWSAPSTNTTIDLTGLPQGAINFRVRARDLAGRIDESPAERNFVVDTVPPVISAVATEVSEDSILVTWTTNEDATSNVDYGLTASYGSTRSDFSYRTSHSIFLSALRPNTEYHLRIRSADRGGNQASTSDIVVRTLPAPDLRVSGVSAPGTLVTGEEFDLGWTVLNAGSAPVAANGSDVILLSTDATLGSDLQIGEFTYPNFLAPGASSDRSQILSIDRSLVPASGNYFLIVFTDSTNAITEESEDNNWIAVPVYIEKVIPPDLVVESVTAPAEAFSGALVEIQFTVKNISTGSTRVPDWVDRVYLSTDNNPSNSIASVGAPNMTYLGPGEQYTSTVNLRIPRNASGSYTFIAWTDSGGQVDEDDDNNNWNRPESRATINITPAPTPNLVPSNVNAPSVGFRGQTMNLTWRVTNSGSAPVPINESTWVDRVYLSRDTELSGDDVRLQTRQRTGGLAINESYQANFTATIPNNVHGEWFVLVKADDSDQVWEYLDEGDNVAADPQAITIQALPPDLRVESVSVPNAAETGDSLTIQWTVKNHGAFVADPSWTDSVYLSQTSTLNLAEATLLGGATRQSALDAGAQYTASTNVTIPLCGSGTKYIFVVTDAGNTVFEFDPGFDAEANNASTGNTLAVTQKAPDLVIGSVSGPSRGKANEVSSFTFTVRNVGQKSAANQWVDAIYLSRVPARTPDSLRVGGSTRTSGLNVGGQYKLVREFRIPAEAEGTYYVIASTDANDSVEECEHEDNNERAAPSQIVITNETAELVPTELNSPTQAFSGGPINVTWTVQNNGRNTLGGKFWTDKVYLSRDLVISSEDRVLGARVAAGPVQQNGTYSLNLAAVCPILTPGNWNVLLMVDDGNLIFEGSAGEGNNMMAQPIAINAPAIDLVVSAAAAPGTGVSGQPITVTWTVTNDGTDRTFGNQWLDYVFLSRDAILDSGDRQLGWRQRTGALDGGASYEGTLTADIPRGLSGPYYVFVRTDWANQVGELNELNNVSAPAGPVVVQLPPPTDLIVETVAAPASAECGEQQTFNWRVKNIGANPALGFWEDAIYLSLNDTWDINDTFVGRVTHNGGLGASGTYDGTGAFEIPAIPPGLYHVIVRTDVRNRVVEVNEQNNLNASDSLSDVTIALLALGETRTAQLRLGQNRYYRTPTEAGQTIAISAVGEEGSPLELFLRANDPATRANHDYRYSNAWGSSQKIKVPSTVEGQYYSLSSRTLPATDETVMYKAEDVPFAVESISPSVVSNKGEATFEILGTRFYRNTKVTLSRGGVVLTPVYQEIKQNDRIVATFDFRGAPTGDYDLALSATSPRVEYDESLGELVYGENEIGSAHLASAVNVGVREGGNAQVVAAMPRVSRRGAPFSFDVRVKNVGSSDLMSPVVSVHSPTGSRIGSRRVASDQGLSSLTFIALGEVRKGRLSPGESITVSLFANPGQRARTSIKADIVESDDSLNWTRLEGQLRIESDNKWSQKWSNFAELCGPTYSTYFTVLRAAAVSMSADEGLGWVQTAEVQRHLIARCENELSLETILEEAPSGTENLGVSYVDPQVPAMTDDEWLFCEPWTLPERLAHIPEVLRAPVWAGFYGYMAWNLNGIGKWDAIWLYFGYYWSGFALYDSFGPGTAINEDFKVEIDKRTGWKARVASAVKWAIEEKCPNIPPNSSVSLDVRSILDPDVIAWLENQLSFPNLLTVPGLIAGGIGSSDEWGPDRRRLHGQVKLVRNVDDCGKTSSIDYEFFIKVDVDDAVDLCPGNVGTGLAVAGTWPMSRYEASGDIFAHGFSVLNIPITPYKGSWRGFERCWEEEDEDGESGCESGNSSCESGGGGGGPSCECHGDCENTDHPAASDPNDKIGPSGFGAQGSVPAGAPLRYQVRFENVATATAPAQKIIVTDDLSPAFNWRTFRLGEIQFGSTSIQVPPGRAFFQTRTEVVGGEGLLVDVTAFLDPFTKRVTWTLQAIDPYTGEPPESPLIGLLPPNDPSGRGEGSVIYTIEPDPGQPTGAVLANGAAIIFDDNPVIETNIVTNTLDAVAPTSQIAPIPGTTTNPAIALQWTKSDDDGGSGSDRVDIYVSTNGGAYQAWRTSVEGGQTTFIGEVGHRYAFYSVAVDNAGNREAAPEQPDATVQVGTIQVPSITSITPSTIVAGSGDTDIEIAGTNYLETSLVRIAGTVRPTTYISATRLKVRIPSVDLSTWGNRAIVVENPAEAGGAQSNVVQLAVVVDIQHDLEVVNLGDVSALNFTLRNGMNIPLNEVEILSATHGGVATSTSLPINYSSVEPLGSRTMSFFFNSVDLVLRDAPLVVRYRYQGVDTEVELPVNQAAFDGLHLTVDLVRNGSALGLGVQARNRQRVNFDNVHIEVAAVSGVPVDQALPFNLGPLAQGATATANLTLPGSWTTGNVVPVDLEIVRVTPRGEAVQAIRLYLRIP